MRSFTMTLLSPLVTVLVATAAGGAQDGPAIRFDRELFSGLEPVSGEAPASDEESG